MISSLFTQITRIKTTFEEYPRQFWVVAFGLMFSSAGSSMIWPFQLIYISKVLALPISSAATLISLSSFAGLVASLLGGAIADHFGRKWIMFAAQAANAVAYILMSQANTYMGFILPMAILGAAMPFYAVGSDSMMADMIPSEKLGGAYAILRMFNNAGISIGPAIGGFIVTRSYNTAFYLAAGAMIAFSVLLLTSVRETLQRKENTGQSPLMESLGGFVKVFTNTSFIAFVVVIAIGMIAPLMMWTLLAVYMNRYFGIPEYLYSWLPITNALMCVFVQYPVTLYTSRMRAKPAISLGMFVYALGVGSVAFMGNLPGFWFSMVLMTMGELILAPTGSKYVAEIAPKELRGRYMSIYWLTWGLARSAAPIAGGYLHDTTGPQSIWWGGLAIGLISTFVLFLLSQQPDNQPQPAQAV